MKVLKLSAIAVTLFLSVGIAIASVNTTTNSSKTNTTDSTKTATHHLMGTITSVNASDLVVTHKYHGKEESSTFVLSTATKKKGSLEKGDQATVYYQVTNNHNVATDVKINNQSKNS